MEIQNNKSLKSYNTFGIDVSAKYFVKVETIEELKDALSCEVYPEKFILSGGSNMLLTKNLDALVIFIAIKGIEVVEEDDSHVLVKAMAGENWHQFVLFCIANDYGGVENLSLIPGNVGTAPIQNIGAYGVEIKDVLFSCEALDIKTEDLVTFTNKECNFGYRESIFKQEKKNQYIIVSATFKLTKKEHSIQTAYGAITTELHQMNIINPSIQDISRAVISIRESKLPSPKEIGNSGSFFKNPVVTLDHFKRLQDNFPNMPFYPVSENEVKIPAGWLIEYSGFKGKTFRNYGVHKKQALVLVNYGGALGSDILSLAKLIQHTIKQLFDISIETEVNII